MIIRALTFIIFLLFLATAGSQVYADDPPSIGLNLDNQKVGLVVGKSEPGDLLGLIIRNSITILFTVGALGFVFMFLWGALSWILSGGDKEKIAAARKRITTAIVGLVLLSLTFVVMIVIGQILGIKALHELDFKIPGLLEK